MAHVLVTPLAVIAPEIAGGGPDPVPVPVPVGEEEVEVAVAVVVGSGHGVDVAILPDPADQVGRLLEPPGAVVAERLCPLGLDREEVRCTVVIEVDEISGAVQGGRRDTPVAGSPCEAVALPIEEPSDLASAMGDVELEPAVTVDVDEREATVFLVLADFTGALYLAADCERIAQADRLADIQESDAVARLANWLRNSLELTGEPGQAGQKGQRCCR